jgi:coenzyme PQQ precursor peptide PqqA
MPRDGALTLSDFLSPTLSIVCEPCNRRGRYSVARLVEEHSDARVTELLVTLTNCPKARSASIYDRCKARLMNTPASTPRCIELIFVSSKGIKARVAELTRCAPHQRAQTRRRNDAMVWSTPEVREVCVGMEVTSYLSAEI